MVADSEPEVEITSVYTSGVRKTESVEDEKEIIPINSVESITEVEINPTKLNVDKNTVPDDISARSNDDGMLTREHKIEDEGAEIGTSDIIFSQDLIIRNANLQPSPKNYQVLNFKRFKKVSWPHQKFTNEYSVQLHCHPNYPFPMLWACL